MKALLPLFTYSFISSVSLTHAQQPVQPANDTLTANAAEDAFKSAENFFFEATRQKNASVRKRMFKTSIKKLKKYIQTFPKHKNTEAATYYLGSSYFQTGKNKLAIIVFKDVIKKYKKGVHVANSANYLGYDAEVNKNYKLAAHYYGIFAKQSTTPHNQARGYYRQAVSHQNAKNEKQAMVAFAKVVEVSDIKSEIFQQSHMQLGHHHFKLKAYAKAKPHFTMLNDKEVKIPVRSEALFFTAQCQVQLDQVEAAIVTYTKILSLSNNQWKPHAQLAILEAYYAASNYKELLSVHGTFGALKPASLQNRRLILAGQAHLKQRQFTAAIKLFKQVEKNKPYSIEAFEANYRRILCYYNLKSNLVTDQVNQFIMKYGNRYPKHRFMHTCLMLQAETLFDSKQFESALKVYRQIDRKLIAKANQPTLDYKLAWTYSQLNKHRQAIQLFSRYLKNYPKDPRKSQILAVRAKGYQATGNNVAAMKDYDQVLKNVPNSMLAAQALQASARIEKEHNRIANMVTRYEKLLALDLELKSEILLNARYWSAWGQFKSKKYKEAVAHIKAAEKLDKGTYKKQLSLLSVLCYFNLKDKEECVKSAKKANLAGIANDIPMGVYRWLGIQCYKSKELADAQLFLSLGVTKHTPTDTPAYYWSLLGKCQYQNQHYKWAIQSLENALKQEKDEAQKVNLMLFKALSQNGENQPELAKATAIEALKKNPSGKTKAMLLQLLGDLHFKAQNYKEAAISYASITEFYEDKEILPYSIAMIIKTLRASGKGNDAKLFEDRLAKEFPDYKLPK